MPYHIWFNDGTYSGVESYVDSKKDVREMAKQRAFKLGGCNVQLHKDNTISAFAPRIGIFSHHKEPRRWTIGSFKQY